MKTIKILAATALLAATTGAFASELDGVKDNAWLNQTPIEQAQVAKQAPAPTASGVAKRDIRDNATDKFGSLNDAVQP